MPNFPSCASKLGRPNRHSPRTHSRSPTSAALEYLLTLRVAWCGRSNSKIRELTKWKAESEKKLAEQEVKLTRAANESFLLRAQMEQQVKQQSELAIATATAEAALCRSELNEYV